MPKNTYTLDLTSETKFLESFEILSKSLDIKPLYLAVSMLSQSLVNADGSDLSGLFDNVDLGLFDNVGSDLSDLSDLPDLFDLSDLSDVITNENDSHSDTKNDSHSDTKNDSHSDTKNDSHSDTKNDSHSDTKPASYNGKININVDIYSKTSKLIKSFYNRIIKHNEESSIEYQIEIAKSFMCIARSQGAQSVKLIFHKKAGLKLATSIAGTDLEVSKSLERDKTIEIEVEF